MPLYLDYRFFCRSIFSLFFLATINAGISQAQITPDGTLPTSVQELENMKKITGGEQVGNNLFHSFDKFSIPTGTEAIFENAPDIQNIFTRITGGEASFIDGLLQTQGGANFFLINPNGIVFGENARLDVGGSFVATTADTIEFADGTSFDARNPNVSLTISVPIGLGLYGNNGSITVNGSGNQITGNSTFSPIQFEQRPTGLSVSEGNTLALVGNGIDFNGGVVTTQGGNIYLTSGESGSVGISQEENGLTLIDDGVTKYQDINLNQQSLVDISGEKVGTVLLTGKTVHLSDASFILAQTQSNAPGGSINIKASEEVLLTGNSPDGEIASTIRSEVLKTAEERGATVYISANRLAMQDEAKIQAMTYSDSPNGIGGQLNINAVESIKVNSSRMSASAFAEGNAGGINISTSELRLIEAASITSSTIGKGDGGEVNIQADLMEVVGANQDAISNISASTFRSGDAGNININTQILRVKDGGSVSSSSFADGNAGSLDINASESIEVSGKSDIFADRSNSQSLIRTMTQLTPPELSI